MNRTEQTEHPAGPHEKAEWRSALNTLTYVLVHVPELLLLPQPSLNSIAACSGLLSQAIPFTDLIIVISLPAAC